MFEMSNSKEQQLLTDCISFIEDVLKNRDWSHGVDHSKQVAKNAVNIWNYNESEKYNKLINKKKFEVKPILIIIISALLHDVLDHKYINSVKNEVVNKMEKLLEKLGEQSSFYVNMIIKNISYSKE
jgi:HD superfamily phosphodiesterase